MKILHYLKKFILFIIKEIFSFFIKLFLFLLVVLAIIGLIVQSIEEKPQVVIKDKAYVVIDLANSYKERSLSSSLFEDDSINFYNLLTNIKNLIWFSKSFFWLLLETLAYIITSYTWFWVTSIPVILL